MLASWGLKIRLPVANISCPFADHPAIKRGSSSVKKETKPSQVTSKKGTTSSSASVASSSTAGPSTSEKDARKIKRQAELKNEFQFEDNERIWEQVSATGDKWTTLEHRGLIFPPDYVPHGLPILYQGAFSPSLCPLWWGVSGLGPGIPAFRVLHSLSLSYSFIFHPLLGGFGPGFETNAFPSSSSTLAFCGNPPLWGLSVEGHMSMGLSVAMQMERT